MSRDEPPDGADVEDPPATDGGGQTPPQPTPSDTDSQSITDRLEPYPVRWGTLVGAIALVVPYLVVAGPLSLFAEEDPFEVAAEITLTLAEFGEGERLVVLLTEYTPIPSLQEVSPADYSGFEDEVVVAVEIIATSPEVPFLILYAIFPFLVFKGGFWLATTYDDPAFVENLKAALTVVAGAALVVIALMVIFTIDNQGDRLLFVGIIYPAIFAGLGAVAARWLTVRGTTASYGWLAVVAGLVAAWLLMPTIEGDLTQLDRGLAALGTYVEATQFGMNHDHVGMGAFLGVAIATAAVGALHTWRIREDIADTTEGVIAGASILYGLIWPMALLLWLYPIAILLLDPMTLSIAGDVPGWGSPAYDLAFEPIELVGGISEYFTAIAIGGVIFPAACGALGGYLAIWHRDN